jgi:DNA-directed RNA polymerase specialized sigma24 family protein
MEIQELSELNATIFKKWRREAVNYLRYYFKNRTSLSDCEDAVSEAFCKLIEDAQAPSPKLAFTGGTVKRIAFCRAVDAFRKTETRRKAPTKAMSFDTPLSINDLFEQKEDDFETIVRHIDALKLRHQQLLALKYKAIPRSHLEEMTITDVHSFISKNYDDSFIAEQYGFKSSQSVRTERHRALNILRGAVKKSQ